jgi:ribonuclease Z
VAGMRVEFLGTGGYHPNERRHTACVLLPEIGLAFDAGTSVFRLPARLETKELDVFLSHAHLDHIAGLTFLLAPLHKGLLERVRVHGKKVTLAAVREHLFAEPLFPVRPAFEYVELEPSVAVPGGGVLTHVPLHHSGGSTGYRIDWPDRSMAYITDTRVDPSYREFVRGVDLLIHECYFGDGQAEFAVKTGHSFATAVA